LVVRSLDEERFPALPDFFSSLASVVLSLETEESSVVVTECLPMIQRLAVRMLEDFPEKLHPAIQSVVAPALLSFIFAMKEKGFDSAKSQFVKVVG
jgi:hypothetical protein